MFPLPVNSKPIPNFPDYCVSVDGIVYSRKLYGSKFGSIGPWWAMKPKKRKDDNHLYVDLFYAVGKSERWYVHELVLLVFVGPKPDGKETRHLDDIPSNNNLSNLCYGTRAENYQDAIRNGKASHGERHYIAKLTNAQVQEIRRMASQGIRRKIIGEHFGVSAHYVSKIVTREIWKHT